jgi:hypothetical protein
MSFRDQQLVTGTPIAVEAFNNWSLDFQPIISSKWEIWLGAQP